MPPVQPNNDPAPTTDYSTAYNEVGNVYDPETKQVQTQIDALPGQQATAQASIDQAKVNAFKDDSLSANSRGVLFGGVVPQADQDYTTNTYNPATTKLATDTANTQQSLAEKIQEINQNRANAAQTLVSDTTTANNEAAAKAAAAAKSAAKVTDAATAKAASASIIQGSKGQYMYVGADGKPINLQQYVTNTGGDVNTVLNQLKSGTAYDKAIYNKVASAKPATAAATLNLIRELDTQKAYGF